VNVVLALVIAYLLGSIPSGYIAGRIRGIDVRKFGSQSVGATNVFRTLGRRTGIAVMAADVLKGLAAVLIAQLLTDPPWELVAAAAAIAGHVFPVWLRFRGGKGVAVGAGCVLGTVTLAALIAIGIWVVIVLITRYVSLASIVGTLSVAPVAWVLGASTAEVAFAAVGGLAVIYFHRANIARLLRGQELRIDFRRRSRGSPAGTSSPP